MMLQTIKVLLTNVTATKLVYAPMDQIKGAGLNDIIKAHQEMTGVGGGCYYFFDEAHHDPDWAVALKALADRRTMDICCATGSSATLLLKGSSESGIGRFNFLSVPPLSFREYAKASGIVVGRALEFEGLDSLADQDVQTTRLLNELEPLFNRFLLWGGFPGQFSREFNLKEWHDFLRQNYVSLTLYKDILVHYEIRDPKVLEDMLLLIAEKASLPLSYDTVAQAFNQSIHTTQEYFGHLVCAGLVIRCDFSTKNTMKRSRRNKKFYVSDTGFNAALSYAEVMDDAMAGRCVETAVAASLHEHLKSSTGLLYPSLEYWRNKYEVDFVIERTRSPLPIEVKYANTIDAKDLMGILELMDERKMKKGVVVTKDTLETRKLDGKVLTLIPARLFLASIE